MSTEVRRIHQIIRGWLILVVFAGTTAMAAPLQSQGAAALAAGDYGRAAQLLRQALDEASPADPGYADVAMQLAESYKGLGLHARAVATLKTALNSQPQHPWLLTALMDVHLALGQPDMAGDLLQQAVAAAQATADPYVISSVLNEVSNVMLAEQHFAEAQDLYQTGLNALAALPTNDAVQALQLTLRINQVRAQLMAGEQGTALAAIPGLAEQVLLYSPGAQQFNLLLALATLSEHMPGHLPDDLRPLIERTLRQAALIAEQQQVARMRTQAYGLQGDFYTRFDEIELALRATRKAIFFARQGQHPELLYRWLWQMGRLQAEQGYLDAAIQSYQQAVATLQPIRNQLFTGYRRDRTFFARMIRPVYLELAGLLLEKITLTRKRQGGNKDLLLAARDQMESLKSAELEDFFQDRCATAAQAHIQTLEQMPERTALLYPIPLPNRLMLLVTLPDGLHYQVVEDASADRVNATARTLRVGLQDRGSGAFFAPSRQLYDWMIKPIEALLQQYDINTLVVAPDAALRLIPFSTLHSGQQFLIEQYAIATVPGISMTDASQVGLDETEVLLSGLSEAVQGFSALPNVSAELSDIREITQADGVLHNQRMTVDELTAAITAKGYPIVHMATHGVFGGSAEDTFLLTYDGRLDMNRLADLIKIGRFRDQPVELLTLSACQTALGDERAALGLAGVAVKAGVRSVIATLWFVDDEATSTTIRDFYRRLRQPGMRKAQALQQAQQALMAQARFRHPAYWAPFLLIGSWR
jgi:CHAT domain-containing protein/Tfp pilus assembly protein PilF